MFLRRIVHIRKIELLPPAVAAAFLVVAIAADTDLHPEEKALNFLIREVPAWRRENGCFSCHNNGDAARALYVASRKGFIIPAVALAETTAWLKNPDRWDDNKGDPASSDKQLADVQFGAALLAAVESAHISDRNPLAQAARRIVAGQSSDGSWPIDAGSGLGSPATYGAALATQFALRTLRSADLAETRQSERRAERFLLEAPVNNTPSASALLLAFSSATDDADKKRKRDECLEYLISSQTSDGGWGPYRASPPEAFDTALALVALSFIEKTSDMDIEKRVDMERMIRRGRQYLIAQQRADGSWIETTRPSGGESYAQRLSTTGWATIALLETK